MATSTSHVHVYLEIGQKRTFAGAIDWPGWCRGGRDEATALQGLLDYGPRYAQALRGARLGFHAPGDVSAFDVVERLAGSSTTDFGAPDAVPSADKQPIEDAEMRRLQAVLKACWRTFDAVVSETSGNPLRKGPRGGGRDVEGIVQHVLGAESGYLSRLGAKPIHGEANDPALLRQAILVALASAPRDGVPARGPRGGMRWTPRYYVRRAVWHVLDHAWEIEDRITL